MGSLNLLNLIFALTLFFQFYLQIEPRSLQITAVNYNYNPKYFTNVIVNVTNNNIWVEGDIIKPLISNVILKLDLKLRLANAKNYQTLFRNDIDICSMALGVKDTYFRKVYKTLIKRGNVMQNCPVYEDHYSVKDYRVDPSFIPTYLIAGDYRTICYLYVVKGGKKKQEFLANATLDGTITA